MSRTECHWIAASAAFNGGGGDCRDETDEHGGMTELAEQEKKYYWLKLDKNFFKRHDIRIIEAMPNGKDYILFYLKLLVESVSHNGMLRFSDAIPYDENMLSTITNTNIDIVRAAISVFTNLQMIEVMDDKTIFMVEVENMTGCETKWAEKKRNYRAKIGQAEDNVPSGVDVVRQEKELEKEKELELEKEEKDIVAPGGSTPSLSSGFQDPGSFEMQCVEKLIESCLETYQKSKVPDTLEKKARWAVEIEKMKRLDGLREEEIGQALQFAIHDSFWKTNIRSAKKFREKFETLYTQSQAKRGYDTDGEKSQPEKKFGRNMQ